jgi:RNA polymerase sigma-70 factor, ECF subfamily
VERRSQITRSTEPDPQEADALRAARRGDPVAFGELYRRYLGDVREFCARRIGDPIRAEDLAQDTFLRAYEKMGAFRPRAAFWPWLSTIARNLCIDELRRRGRAAEVTTQKVDDGTATRAIALDPTSEPALAAEAHKRIDAAVAAALGRLSDRDRTLVWNHAVEELSWGEIASRHKISTHAARNAAWRARGLLRSILVESLGDLRACLVWPIAAFLSRMRRRWNRVQARATPSWVSLGEVVCARTAELVVAAMFVSVGWLAGSNASAPSILISSRPSMGRSAVPDGPKIAAAATHTGRQVKFADQTLDSTAISASISAGSRPGGATPSSAHYRVEIRTPDGQLIYWSETTIRCGDGRPSRLTPQGSPASAYC